jgi:hypothetical protein
MPHTGREPKGTNDDVQSILIPYSYSLEEAIKWLKDHNFYSDAPDFTNDYMRFRQWDPKKTDRYRSLKLRNAKGMILVYRL